MSDFLELKGILPKSPFFAEKLYHKNTKQLSKAKI